MSLRPRNVRNYGWRPDLPDQRDHAYTRKAVQLPSSADLRPHCPPVFDQGLLGSCTGNAMVGVLEILHLAAGHKRLNLSRLFAYYNARVLEDSVASDNGAEIRDVVKAAATVGVCVERDCVYDVRHFARKPSATAYTNAILHKVVEYQRITTLDDMRDSLAHGFPVIFGFTVYESFESEAVAVSGELNMPAPHEASVGGHAVVLVGYDDASQRMLVRNSWGEDWGKAGYFTMPYAYVTDRNLSDDFWTARK